MGRGSNWLPNLDAHLIFMKNLDELSENLMYISIIFCRVLGVGGGEEGSRGGEKTCQEGRIFGFDSWNECRRH